MNRNTRATTGVVFAIKYYGMETFARPVTLRNGATGIGQTGVCAEGFAFPSDYAAKSFIASNLRNYPELENAQAIRIISHNPLDVA